MDRKHKRDKQQRNALLVVLFGVALLISAIFLIGGNQASNPVLGDAVSIARGEQIYAANCAACHGESGMGHVVPEAPALNGNEHAWHHADGQLQQIILDGGQIMPPFRGILSNQDAAAVIRYIQTWWAAGQLQSQQSISAQNPLQ